MGLFRKRTTGNQLSVIPATTAGHGTALAPHGSNRQVLEQYAVRSLVDKGVVIDGNVTTHAGAAIDGTVRGNVCVLGASSALLIRGTAHVAGTINAPIVMVAGTVHGKIEARFVRLYAGSRVRGHISAARLIVDDGAIIESGAMDAGIGAAVVAACLPSTAVPADLRMPTSEDPTAPPLPRQSAGAADFIDVLNRREQAAASLPPAWAARDAAVVGAAINLPRQAAKA